MNFKRKYKLLIGLWIVVSIALIITNSYLKFIKEADTSIILGCISIGISMFSLGLADMSKKRFKGIVTASLLKEQMQPGGEGNTIYNKIKFHIVNTSGVSITNFTVSFRLPQKYTYISHRNDQHYSVFKFGETVILTSDILKFMGTESGYNDIVFEHHLNITDWLKGNLLLTVSGDNIEPTTFSIKLGEIEKFKMDKIIQMKKYKPSAR